VSVLLNTTVTGATIPAFAPQQAFATGRSPFSVAVGDFNGDGKPDLAVANHDSNTVSVLLNNMVPVTLGGSPATGTISSALEAPAAIAVVAGSSPQSAVVGTAFATPLAADVRNAAGHLVQNVSVTFTAPGSGPSGRFGSSTTATAVTDASGRATAPTFVANTSAGSYTVTAQAAGGSNPSTTFSLTNLPGAPAVLTATAGGSQSATVNTAFTTNLLASLTDQYGNRVPGVLVTFTAPDGGASATFAGGNSGTTDATGQVSKGITANIVAGSYLISAVVSGGSSPSALFLDLTNTPDVPAGLAAAIGSNQSATVNTPFATSLWAFVFDRYGNTVPGALVTFSAPGSGASATFTGGSTGTTNANGLVVKGITANTVAGTYSISAVASGGSNPSALFVDLTNLPGAADHFVVTTTAANPDMAGTPFDVTATAQDLYGNAATGYTGTAHFTSLDPYGATLPTDYPFRPGDRGTHTFAGGATLYTAGTWDVTATDTGGGLTGSVSVNVVAAPAVAFLVTAPASATAGMAFDFTVTAIDPYGNTDTTYTGTVSFSTMDPAGFFNPSGYTFQPGDMGAATFPQGATLNTAGNSWDVTATDGNGLTGSAYVTVTLGPPTPGGGFPGGLEPPGASGTPAPASAPGSAGTDGGHRADQSAGAGATDAALAVMAREKGEPSSITFILPLDYPLGTADGGVHSFDGLALRGLGSQRVMVTDLG
jgi:hypothetical protein